MCLAEALLRIPDSTTINDLIEDKIAVWGNPVKKYLIKNGICRSENIILSGSPRHENYIPSEEEKLDKLLPEVKLPFAKTIPALPLLFR